MAVVAVDRSSGFNLLQAAVFEGNYDAVIICSVFLNNFCREMDFESTTNNAKILPSKTACDIVSTLNEQDHTKIKTFYEETCEMAGTLTELHLCGDNDDAEKAVELVLHHGMDINIAAKGNRTPLMLASLRGSAVLIKTLIDLGANVNALREDHCTPLLMATYWNNYMAVRLFTETGVDTDIQDERFAALHISAIKGFVDIAQLLIEAGCNVNLQNSSGKTSLHLAVQNKHKHLTEILLENQADVNIRDNHDPTERLHLVRRKGKIGPSWHYVDVKKASSGLFDKRVKDGSIRLARFGTVLESGRGEDPPESKREEVRAKVHSQVGKKDKTALHFACEIGDEQIIELLVKHGADVNACDAYGFTPLQLAAIQGNMSVVKKLVELKADVNLTTADGKDAADYAHLNEETEIEEFLKSKRSLFRKLLNMFSRKQ